MKLSILDLVEPAPVLAETATLEVVFDRLTQCQSEWIIALDAEGQPHYAIALQPLMSSVLDQLTIASGREVQGVLLKCSILQLTANWTTGLEPLQTLSVQGIPEPEDLLNTSSAQCWAVMDETGVCLGLLHRAVLECWCLQTAAIASAPQNPASTNLSTDTDTGNIGPLPATNLSLLAELLDHLPIPLMLQTRTGQVVTQNATWKAQVDPLHSLAPPLTEPSTAPESSSPAQAASERPTPQGSQNMPGYTGLPRSPFELLASQSQGVLTLPPQHIEPTCRFGTDVNTCICVYENPTGQPRIWEFVKVPLKIGSVRSDSVPAAEARTGSKTHLNTLSLLPLAPSPERLQADPNFVPPSKAIAPPIEPLWLVVAKDVTEQYQLTQELTTRNTELAQLNRFKDEFLACISHELKTPLTAVLGLSSLLKDQMLGPLNERQARYARLIHQSGRHLMMIVNDILDLTRLEAGKLELTYSSVRIERVCLQAYEQARQLQPVETEDAFNVNSTEGSNLPQASFRLNLQPGIESVVADDLRLRQMLTNLLSNALKFTPPEGRVGLDVEVWDEWLAFTVWDTGIGIPTDKQHLIFQKFQQLENSLARRFEGTGLGLVLTQRLAQIHGGDLSFVSQEGKGSRFTLLLPLAPGTTRGSDERTSSSDRTALVKGKRLALLVDASSQHLVEQTRLLEDLGCRVAIARSGAEALEKIRGLHPVFVLMTPHLPLLSGWDVLTLVKARSETQNIPVFIMGSMAEKVQAITHGANGFLPLPLQPSALRETLITHLTPVTAPPPSPPQPTILTILQLRLGDVHPDHSSLQKAEYLLPLDLPHLLQPYPCRVLQVDDLEQAELLVRVWKPQVVLLDSILPDPASVLQHLSQYPMLTSLPFVTLTPENTQAANQIKQLTVYPCLASLQCPDGSGQLDVSALLAVMQVAAGIA